MLLPSPTTSDANGADANGAGAHGTGGPDLRTALDDLMPTPRAGDGEKGGPNQRGSSGDLMLPSAVQGLGEDELFGTPTARMWKGSGPVGSESHRWLEEHGNVEAQVLSLDLLPTPAVNDMGAAWDEWTARIKAAHNNGNGHGDSLNIEAQRIDMLPTPKGSDGDFGTPSTSGRSREKATHLATRVSLLPTTTTRDAAGSGGNPDTTGTHGTTLTDAAVRQPSRWGKYAAAIARWEAATQPAPEPTNVTDGYLKARAKRLARKDQRPIGMRGSLKVRRQLAAKFSEWMMGVPRGWITDTPGITRNEALKAAGNGVVPQQAAEALRFLLAMPTGRQIADAHQPDDLLELLAVEA